MRQILMVDDEELVLMALVRAVRQHLRDEVVVVETFTDPLQALARLQVQAFDVVISDFRMPQMTGVDFLFAVRELAPESVRMVLSASTDFETVSSAIAQAQVFRYIAKPWEPEALRTTLQEAFAERDRLLEQKHLADRQRMLEGRLTAEEVEARRLEDEEPGLTKVNWGPNGEVLL